MMNEAAKKYTKAEPGNPRYAGIYYYLNKKEQQNIVIFYKDSAGKQRTETLGLADSITLEKAYEERQRRRGKPVEHEDSAEGIPAPYSALFQGVNMATGQGKVFSDLYAANKGSCTFLEIALAFLVMEKFSG